MRFDMSLTYCAGTEELTRLCERINQCALDDSLRSLEKQDLSVFGVGRLKKDVALLEEPEPLAAGTCFVMWSGEAESQLFWLSENMRGADAGCFCGIFLRYIQDYLNVFEVFRLESCSGIREDEWVRAFRPDRSGQIDLSLIERL